MNKVISEGETRDIGHRAWKVYRKIFSKIKEDMKKAKEFIEAYPGLKQTRIIKDLDLDAIIAKLEEHEDNLSEEKEKELWKLSFEKERLESIIVEINKTRKELEEEITIYVSERDVKEIKKALMDYIFKINPTAKIAADKIKRKIDKALTPQLIRDLLNIVIAELPSYAFCSLSLYYLSLVFSPHATKPRYPQAGHNPLEVYNERMPLIQVFNHFIEITEETLNALDRIFNSSTRLSFTFQLDSL
ncbi:MAG TPA: hypothetical protein VNL13_01565 [Sulfolobales archaeon]|nr:hypothetical protein [Sulfolobales archaeon]